MYRCPICGFKTIRLFALKQHVRRGHILTVCPVCGKNYSNIYQHFYTHAYSDSQHLVLCYLYTRYRLLSSAKKKVKELLSEG
jgi:transcription elongation factor Elf1